MTCISNKAALGLIGIAALAVIPLSLRGEPPAGDAHDYVRRIRPLLERYCHECHAGDVTEADIDLASFRTLPDVRKEAKVWLKVRTMLDSGQMPPREAEQPADPERAELRKWVRDFLAVEARARAGDPGPVVLRRLSNAEYTFTIRDLTGVDTLDPTREFPVDGAAGEGFTNLGNGQGMSPALVQKYLDAAKEVASRAVLLPDGVRFSRYSSRRDQTDELLAEIQAFYRRFTKDGGGSAVDLQGIKFDTNQGGLLPLERYLATTLAERDALQRGETTIDAVARQHSLSPRYLATLWRALTGERKGGPSSPIDPLRERWRSATAGDAGQLAAEIEAMQKANWKFNSVGHIGLEKGPRSWMEPVSPITTERQFRFKLPDAAPGGDVVFHMAASDFGDGNDHDFVVWQRPRIEFKAGKSDPPREPILLADVRKLTTETPGTIAAEAARTKLYLDTVVSLRSRSHATAEIAKEKNVDARLLERWATLVRLRAPEREEITGHFTEKLKGSHEAINGWGSSKTPSLLTNRAAEPISLGTPRFPARGVTVHPSPVLDVVVAWRSPLAGELNVAGRVADADDKCGNGIAWRLELRSDSASVVLASGAIGNGGDGPIALDAPLKVKAGDVLALVVGARDGSHVCDTTQVELKLAEEGGEGRTWDLAADLVDNILQANPLPDSYGNKATWHFLAEKQGGKEGVPQRFESPIPPGSALARWRAAVLESKSADEIDSLAGSVQEVLTATEEAALDAPDVLLRQRLLTGLDPGRFSKHPDGTPLAAADLCLQAPHILEVRLPAALAAGGEFVTTAILHAETGREGSVQVEVATAKPAATPLLPASPDLVSPVLVSPQGDARQRLEGAMQEFRELFPPALCYARIVPVDEVVTLALFYREDDLLKRLMLDDGQLAEIDRLWDELLYVSQEPLKLEVAFEQISEFATQDNPKLVKALAPKRGAICGRAEAFRQRLIRTEPAHVSAVLEFADRAWRRPLIPAERQALRAMYRDLRESDLAHDEAVRLLLARLLTSPEFLFKLEQPPPGQHAAPVTDLKLATRLSYFLWSSLPDDDLRQIAQAGKLVDDAELAAQARRMLKDPRARRLAVQFACQWLHLVDFDQNDDKNEKLYPEFAALRGDMYEETVRFFEEMFRNDGSIVEILTADHTFLNEPLARHYGIDSVRGAGWRRVDRLHGQGRGGLLGMAAFLASQSGASRTSPILRGNWIYETLLGERLPRPPANVPQLPEAVPSGLTARQLIERHSSDAACAKCHARIDPYGFALEQYDAIGRLRPQRVDTGTTLADGTPVEGIDGLRRYLAEARRDDVVRNFCRKLLGYALGRGVQLSDEPLLTQMQTRLAANEYRFGLAVEMIVTSRQFREIRGGATAAD